MEVSIPGSTWCCCDSFSSRMPCAIVCTTSACLSRMWMSVEQNFSRFCAVGSDFSKSMTSSKLFAYQVLTRPTDGVRRRLSGRRAISFIMFAKRTGSSFRRKTYDFFSHAFRPGKKNLLEMPRKIFSLEYFKRAARGKQLEVYLDDNFSSRANSNWCDDARAEIKTRTAALLLMMKYVENFVFFHPRAFLIKHLQRTSGGSKKNCVSRTALWEKYLFDSIRTFEAQSPCNRFYRSIDVKRIFGCS